MKEVNIEDKDLLQEKGVCIKSGQHKKHLTKLINKTLPNVEFAPTLRKNESEPLCTREIMTVVVDELADKFTDG